MEDTASKAAEQAQQPGSGLTSPQRSEMRHGVVTLHTMGSDGITPGEEQDVVDFGVDLGHLKAAEAAENAVGPCR